MPSRALVAPVVIGNGSLSGTDVVTGEVYLIHRPQQASRPATILETRVGKQGIKEAYISYLGEDKRLDTWVRYDQIGEKQETSLKPEASLLVASKPSLTVEVPVAQAQVGHSAPSSPEREHAVVTRVRNFEDVRFGEYLIKTWYYSPYPTIEDKPDERASSPVSVSKSNTNKRRRLNGDGSSSEVVTGQSGLMGNGHGSHAKGNGHASESGHLPSSKLKSSQDIFNGTTAKVVEATRGRIWVCDLCFKYMRNRASWDRHSSSCSMLLPPGRRVYQKGSYTLWEIDGAQQPLYCQNLSLFGKLFIDHKSVFFHVENFLFYVLCDAATSRRDQVMAFFSKEKVSYDNYNLACIITFPPFQNRGFGKLLIEFSYYLTQHPATRSNPIAPGTPERPLSDLGLKGYTAYWISIILRFCNQALADAPPYLPQTASLTSPSKRPSRSIKSVRRPVPIMITINGIEVSKTHGPNGQHSISLSLADLAQACHLRPDDVASTLSILGFLQHRRQLPPKPKPEQEAEVEEEEEDHEEQDSKLAEEANEWQNAEVVITREAVEREWAKWKVRPMGVLDETCVLL